MIRLREGGNRSIEWPEVSFSLLETEGRPLIVLSGPEPRLMWRTFCEQVVEVAQRLSVTTAVSLGALLAEVHHAQPVSVFGASSDADLTQRLVGANKTELKEYLDIGAYLVPHSDIVSLMVLEHQCRMHNLLTKAAMEYRRLTFLQRAIDRVFQLVVFNQYRLGG